MYREGNDTQHRRETSQANEWAEVRRLQKRIEFPLRKCPYWVRDARANRTRM